jgi:hypothetical protein
MLQLQESSDRPVSVEHASFSTTAGAATENTDHHPASGDTNRDADQDSYSKSDDSNAETDANADAAAKAYA